MAFAWFTALQCLISLKSESEVCTHVKVRRRTKKIAAKVRRGRKEEADHDQGQGHMIYTNAAIWRNQMT
jgi:hypothetical protein